MGIEYYLRQPSESSYWRLFLTTGWNEKLKVTPRELFQAVAHSRYCVSAYEGENLVGFGRVVTDGFIYAMIYDLIVDPVQQGRGIGTKILQILVEKCQSGGIREIQLISARGKVEFYLKRGFNPRPEDGPGMQYRPMNGGDGNAKAP